VVFIAKISKRMNVLILTPDAVGSTLLQRLITIYMQFCHYDRPVINLHELTNGLVKYHNATFDQEVLGKKSGKWGYYQSLEQIVELLSSVNHYKTSRLAHYHLQNRQDSVADLVPFYQYLNENFYIISCRRHNVFEHALSWCLSKVTKKLNVYSGAEKIDSFFDLYRNGIDIDPNSLLQTLNAYKNYVQWCDNHFDVANYFYYEEHLPLIEKYILNLPIFTQQTQQLTWKDHFGMQFDQWNLCHYITSDLGTLALDQPEHFAQLANHARTFDVGNADHLLLKGYKDVRDPSWPEISTLEQYKNLPQHIRNEIELKHNIRPEINTGLTSHTELSQPLIELLPETHQNFVSKHLATYNDSITSIKKLIDAGVIINQPPIKKQTLAEKKHMVRNYQHLLQVYNQWIEENPNMGRPLTNDILDQFAAAERARWTPTDSAVTVSAQLDSD
jgi:hypothetical protein